MEIRAYISATRNCREIRLNTRRAQGNWFSIVAHSRNSRLDRRWKYHRDQQATPAFVEIIMLL